MTPVALFSAGQVAALEAGEPVYLPVDGSSVLPAVATKCPSCADGEPFVHCPDCTEAACCACGGSGWVGDPLGVATKQWRRLTNSGVAATEWSSVLYKPVRPDPNVECRTAVVAYTWVTEHLPVTSAEDVLRFSFRDNGPALALAPHLRVGQVVLRCEGLVHLEQPITETLPCIDQEDFGSCRKGVCWQQEVAGISCAVPLVVPPATITEVPDA